MKKLLLAVGLALLALTAVLVVRALRLTVDQPPIATPLQLEVDANRVTQSLAQAVRHRTITHSQVPRYDDATFDAFRKFLRQRYPRTFSKTSSTTLNRHTLLLEWKGTEASLKPMMLLAHQDVVPLAAGTESAWTHPAFDGVIKDGFVWGRGTLDDKGALIAILEATERLIETGFVPRRTIYLGFGHDEEIGGQEGARAMAEVLEARGVRLAFVLDEGAVITQKIIPDVATDVALIGVAEKGYVSLRITAAAETGHSSMPPTRTAIGSLSRALTRLENNQFPPRLGNASLFFKYVAPKMPFIKRVAFANLWLLSPVVIGAMNGKPATAASIRTTIAPTILESGHKDNVLPTSASAVVNFRIIPGETPESVKAHVESVVSEEGASVDWYGKDPLFRTAPAPVSSIETDAYRAISMSIRQVANDPELIVAPSLVLGATDSRHLAEVSDNVYRFGFARFGPDDIRRVHGIDERVATKTLADAVRFHAQLIVNMSAKATK